MGVFVMLCSLLLDSGRVHCARHSYENGKNKMRGPTGFDIVCPRSKVFRSFRFSPPQGLSICYHLDLELLTTAH